VGRLQDRLSWWTAVVVVVTVITCPVGGDAATKLGALWLPEMADIGKEMVSLKPRCPLSHTIKSEYAITPSLFHTKPIAKRVLNHKRSVFDGFVRFATAQASGSVDTGGKPYNPHGNGDTVVITLANFDYLNTLMNWLHSIVAVGVENYLIVCLDEKLHLALTALGIPAFYDQELLFYIDDVFGANQRREAVQKQDSTTRGVALKRIRLGMLWCKRMLLIRTLLEAGLNVVQSDADAIVLRNPFSYLNQLPGDIVAQRGVFPIRVTHVLTGAAPCKKHDAICRQRHGAMCFGFIMYRSTPATLALIELAWPMLLATLDDQRGVQLTMINCFNFTWSNDGAGGSDWKDAAHAKHQASDIARTATEFGTAVEEIMPNTRLTITFLPFALFPRHCGEKHNSPEKAPDVFVAHCYAKKDGASKSNAARKQGLIFLKDDWRTYKRQDHHESTAAFLMRLGEHPALMHHPRALARNERKQAIVQ
jgi:hypothetical protein